MSRPSSKRALCSTEIPLDVYLIGKPLSKIPNTKLPSKREMLQMMAFNTRISKLTVRESARLSVRKALELWINAGIPTRRETRCIEKLEKLRTQWASLQKNRLKITENQKNKETLFVNGLDDLFDLAHINAMLLIKEDKVRRFLLQQREPGRKGCLPEAQNKSDQKRRKVEMPQENVECADYEI